MNIKPWVSSSLFNYIDYIAGNNNFISPVGFFFVIYTIK